jgi:hypothetical protein
VDAMWVERSVIIGLIVFIVVLMLAMVAAEKLFY